MIITGALVLLAWIPLRQKPGIGTISNVFVVGLAADAALALIPEGGPLRRRSSRCSRPASVLNAVAGAAYIGARPRPGPARRPDDRPRAPHRRRRSAQSAPGIELSVLAVGFALGGTRRASAPSSTRSRSARCCSCCCRPSRSGEPLSRVGSTGDGGARPQPRRGRGAARPRRAARGPARRLRGAHRRRGDRARPQRADDARRGLPARDARPPARRRDDRQGRHRLRVQPRARHPVAPGDDRRSTTPTPAPARRSSTAPTSPRSARARRPPWPATCSRDATPARSRSSAPASRASTTCRRSRSSASSTRSASARSTARTPSGRRAASATPAPWTIAEEAVRGADVVALATHAAQPVIEPGWIAPGTHVSSVGYRPPDGELPRELLARRACSSRPRGLRADAGRLRGARPASTRRRRPSSARSCSAARPAARARRDHGLQGDGPRRRGHRRRRARLRGGPAHRRRDDDHAVAPPA